jgi:hypothetical protein
MLAVTTRNVLRHPGLFFPMLYARLLVARQLAQTPGLIRYAGGIVGPTEFLTLTVWEDKGYMQAFASSGAHRRFMWLFARWSESFWSLRWDPTEQERGAWAGLNLAGASPEGRPLSPLVRLGLIRPDPVPRSPLALEPRGAGVFGTMARHEGPAALALAVRARRRLAAEARNGTLLRWAVGVDLPPQLLVVTIWRDLPGAREPALRLLGEELGLAWAMCWRPGDYEVGHWSSLRLRQLARLGRRTPAATASP